MAVQPERPNRGARMTTYFRRSHGSNTASPHPVEQRRASLRRRDRPGRIGARAASSRRTAAGLIAAGAVDHQRGDQGQLIPSNSGGPHCGEGAARNGLWLITAHPVEQRRASLRRGSRQERPVAHHRSSRRTAAGLIAATPLRPLPSTSPTHPVEQRRASLRPVRGRLLPRLRRRLIPSHRGGPHCGSARAPSPSLWTGHSSRQISAGLIAARRCGARCAARWPLIPLNRGGSHCGFWIWE